MSNDERFNPFRLQSDSLELGKVLELRQVFDGYLRQALESKQRKRKTIQAVERHLRAFEGWWHKELEYWKCKSQIEIPRPVVASLTIQHLTAFQQSLRNGGRTGRYANQALGSIRQILRCAEAHGLIVSSPRVESLVAPKAAPKVYLTDEHLTALWTAAESLAWPVRRRDFQPLHCSPTTAWRSCLVLWVLYGLRTQELVALEEIAQPIRWSNIVLTEETPNPAGYTRSEWGWLVYVPPKQSWVKDEPLYLPLTKHARAALEHLRPADWTPETPVCDWTLSSTSFYATWHGWTKAAGIAPKVGTRFLVKHLRKTCSTRIKNHRPGLSSYVTGHASDRSGTSSVSEQHYENAEQAILECMETIPVPAAFDEILRRPGG